MRYATTRRFCAAVFVFFVVDATLAAGPEESAAMYDLMGAIPRLASLSPPWVAGQDPCTFAGVTCTNGNVTAISLSDLRLAGTIPDSIANVSRLQIFSLPNNLLSGAFNFAH